MELERLEMLSSEWGAYELLDSGSRLKLERFGDCVVIRGEPKAWWPPSRPELWDNARARYLEDVRGARWSFSGNVGAPVLECGGLKFATKFMDGSKHLGIFPEQKPHWEYVAAKAREFVPFEEGGRIVSRPRLLNLFGYTGVATLFAESAGWFVTHVDASRPSVEWARRNQLLSGLPEDGVRWIVDDALKFVRRQRRRGAKYEAIILDPPAFGRGPKNELWKLEKMLPELLSECAGLLSEAKMFALITLYSIDASPIMAANVLRAYLDDGGRAKLSAGELVLKPRGGGYRLPLSIWARAEFEPRSSV